MGVQYYIICRKCRVYRDLDKFYIMLQKVSNRKDAIKFADEIKKIGSFRSSLLISFMYKHWEHDCFLTNEHNDLIDSFDEENIDF